jgi:hypothetical protein
MWYVNSGLIQLKNHTKHGNIKADDGVEARYLLIGICGSISWNMR